MVYSNESVAFFSYINSSFLSSGRFRLLLIAHSHSSCGLRLTFFVVILSLEKRAADKKIKKKKWVHERQTSKQCTCVTGTDFPPITNHIFRVLAVAMAIHGHWAVNNYRGCVAKCYFGDWEHANDPNRGSNSFFLRLLRMSESVSHSFILISISDQNYQIPNSRQAIKAIKSTNEINELWRSVANHRSVCALSSQDQIDYRIKKLRARCKWTRFGGAILRSVA